METKNDWHYGNKTRPLLTKRKKRRGIINVNIALKKNKVGNQIDETYPSTSYSTPNVRNNLLNYHDPAEISISSIATNEKNTSWDNLEGRRIINIQYVFERIQSIKHDGFDCSFRNLQFTKENRLGFFSSFYFQCKICGIEEIIKSEELDDNNINVNMAMVSSIVNTGQGYSQLEEFSATLNMPNMSNKLYQDFHNNIYKHLNDLAWNEMLTAGKEEAKLALEKGEIDHLGRPKIAVVADGAWSKRSYKTKYNALSGVACIIGARTKKVIFLGVRNKYCSICQLSENREDVINEHICFKNWNTASTAMEADIIVEGFKQSLNMHNIIYSQLIGDGDSSIMKRLRLEKPYGSNFVIKKVECTNHLLRNYINRLRDIGGKRKNDKGNIVPGCYRKAVQDRLLRLRYAVTEAVKFRRREQTDRPYEDTLALLKTDINNGPNHVFGDHSKCHSYFCHGQKSGEDNLVADLKHFGVWDDISRARNLLTYHTESLWYGYNNNSAELYNSILTKFVGGKRINFSLRGSYQLRCNAAVTAYNSGYNRLSLFNKHVTTKSPGKYTKMFIKRHQRSSETRRRRRCLFSVQKNKTKTTGVLSGPDENYGDIPHDPLAELSTYEVQKLKNKFMENLKLTDEEIQVLEKKTKRQHQCDEWHLERKKRLTASSFGKICKMRESTSREKVVKEMLFGTFNGNSATRYGIAHEDIAKEELEKELKGKIEAAGLFVDSEISFLACSPDGLVGNDTLVEIKCPISARAITPKEGILLKKIKSCQIEDGQLRLKRNDNYFYQIQGQLHIARKTFCYFCVWTPKGLMFEKIKRDDKFWKEKMEPQLTHFYVNYLLPEILKENLL